MSMEFFNFCSNNQLEEAQWLYSRGGVDLSFKDPGKRTALSMAARKGHVEVVLWLIENGANLEIPADNDHRTALGCAAVAGMLETAVVLIDAGADVDAINRQGDTILIDAIKSKQVEISVLLVESGADLDRTNKYGQTAYYWAETQFSTPELESRLAKALAVNKGKQDETVVSKESRNEPIGEIVEEEKQEVTDEALFLSLCRTGLVEEATAVWAQFLGREQDILNRGLVEAIIYENLSHIEALIDLGGDLFYQSEVEGKLYSPIELAVLKGNVSIVSLLIKKGGVVEEQGPNLLIYALKSKNIELVGFLLDQQASVLGYADDEDVLSLLVEYGDCGLDLIKRLIPKDMPVIENNLNVISALSKAYNIPNSEEVIKYLKMLEDVLDLEMDLQYLPSLYAAIVAENLPAVSYYIQAGADVNELMVDVEKKTVFGLLSVAIEKHHLSIVRELLQAGVNVNEKFYYDEDVFSEFKEVLIGEGYQLDSRFYPRELLQKTLEKKYATEGKNLSTVIRHGKYGIYQSDYMVQGIETAHRKRDYTIVEALIHAGLDIHDIPESHMEVTYNNTFYLEHLLSIPDFSFSYENFQTLEPTIHLFLNQQLRLDLNGIRRIIFELNNNRYTVASTELINRLFEQLDDINEVNEQGQTILHSLLAKSNPETDTNDFLTPLLNQERLDVNIFDYDDYSPLCEACKNQSVAIIGKLLDMGADVMALCGQKRVPLTTVALERGDKDILARLCDYGADVNITDELGQSLLHLACEKGDCDWIRQLVEAGADVVARNREGNTPLHLLVCEGLMPNKNKGVTHQVSLLKHQSMIKDAVDLLLEKGAQLDAFNHTLQTPLFRSAFLDDRYTWIFEYLLNKGALIDVQDKGLNTIFHLVAQSNDVKKAKWLLEYGADPYTKNEKEKTPYQLAIESNRRSMISLIEKSTATLTVDGDDVDKAFMRACQNGKRGVAQHLIKSGNIDITYVDEYGRTALHYVSKLGMVALAQLLINQGIDLDYTDQRGQTALHFAAGNMYKEVFKLLVENGADTNIADELGVLPIMLVTDRGQHDLLLQLLEAGADAHVANNEGRGLLHLAVIVRNHEMVRILLQHGVNSNLPDDFGDTPLHMAVRTNQKGIATMLLEGGADVHLQTVQGNTGIHLAAMNGFISMMDMLLDAGVDINTYNNEGLIPLHLAVIYKKKDVFKRLLEKGANFEAKTNHEETVMDLAVQTGQKEIIERIAVYQKRKEMGIL